MNSRYIREVFRVSPPLAITAWINFALLLLSAAAAMFDARTILGLNAWIKPMKFEISIVIYTVTVALLLRYVADKRRAVSIIGWGIAVSMMIEIVCIDMQAFRGTTSHFNVKNAFDAAVFTLMGIAIVNSTLLAAYLLLLFLRRVPALASAHLWGIRLGLLLFVIFTMEGLVMVGHSAHTVGAADGGPGLPFVNWSTRAGDLRVAHFLGMHALQIFPIAGWLLSQRQDRTAMQLTALFTFFVIYVSGTTYFLLQALRGIPMVLW